MNINEMRIIIQIPCFNEEETIPETIADIAHATAEYKNVEILIIDDGSVDGTVEAARQAGADWAVLLPNNVGLARAFQTGLRMCLALGADVIVNTDADNQYKASSLRELLDPVKHGCADMVIGARPISDIGHFPLHKKLLQRLGSATVRYLSGTNVQDVTSGFRAMTRDMAIRLNVFTPFSYTLETIIQAGQSGYRVTSAPIEVNPPTRPSRLFRSIPQYIWRSTISILRVYAIYKPARSFMLIGLLPFSLGMILFLRYLAIFLFLDPTRSHAPSLILASVMLILTFILWAIGVLGDSVAVNRRLLEESQLVWRSQNPTDVKNDPSLAGIQLLSFRSNETKNKGIIGHKNEQPK